MKLSIIEKETIQTLEGSELQFRDFICMVEYPFIWSMGEKKKLTQAEWKELLDQYWNDSNNDGYWLKKEAELEFGGVKA